MVDLFQEFVICNLFCNFSNYQYNLSDSFKYKSLFKMAGIKGLVSLAFTGSIGMTFVILACALPAYGVWWPFFVVLFYVLSPIPTMVARRYTDSAGGTNSTCMESAIFMTMGFLISSFALPIVLAHAGTIALGACFLTLAGNVIVYLTILGFFTIFDSDDADYAMW